MDKKSPEYLEKRRKYAAEYRKKNSELLSERHKWRLENDPDYAERYRLKQEKRKHKYQESHAAAVQARLEKRKILLEHRVERERERHRKAKAKKREDDREAYNAHMREYNSRNRDRINARRRELWNGDLKYRSKQHYAMVMSKYGLTREAYEDLYLSQNGRCAICKASEADLGEKGLSVDHCHSAGNVRGLLCRKCNTALGSFSDSIELLKIAIHYLERR